MRNQSDVNYLRQFGLQDSTVKISRKVGWQGSVEGWQQLSHIEGPKVLCVALHVDAEVHRLILRIHKWRKHRFVDREEMKKENPKSADCKGLI